MLKIVRRIYRAVGLVLLHDLREIISTDSHFDRIQGICQSLKAAIDGDRFNPRPRAGGDVLNDKIMRL